MADEFNDNGFSTFTWQLMTDFDVLGENRACANFSTTSSVEV